MVESAGTVSTGESRAETYERRYRVGTLVYTRAGLVMLFFWMLWGDFCFQIMELVMPKVLPLQLKDMGASDVMISVLVSSLPGVMNMFVTPVVSFRSDRFRSRWGRRIPFLLIPAPFVAFFLSLLAYAGEIGGWLHRVCGVSLGLSPMSTALVTVSLLVILFKLFDMFGASVYYYLFNDVVPKEFLGRFMALFRIVGTAAGFAFNMFVFGYAKSHMKEIYLGAAALYLTAFTIMCLCVREGEYPPPPIRKSPGWVDATQAYFRECFSIPFYVVLFLKTSLWSMSNATDLFTVFFAQESLHIDLDQFGDVNGYALLLTMLLLYPMGWLSDRFHPLRMYLCSMLLTIPLTIASFLWMRGPASFAVLTLLKVPIRALMLATTLPLIMSLFPKERFGQFSSAQALVNATVLVIGSFAAGLFMDWIHDYRYLWAWMGFFELLSLACMVYVYRGWLRYGGKEHYVPPQAAGG